LPPAFNIKTANDLQGKTFELELNGFLATVFQHEFDHLDGVLYVDRLKDSRLLVFEDLLELSEEDAQGSGRTRP
jgi:peptide deformylase